MGFALDVSEVGPAEYPLIGVLRDTVFGEFPHQFTSSVEQLLDGRQDLLALIAHLEGNPVGFAVGFRNSPIRFHLSLCGVLKEYRRQGLMTRMMQWQENFARSRGYRTILLDTFNHFPGMLQLSLKQNYLPVGVERTPEGDLAIRLAKSIEPQPPGAVPLRVRKPPRPLPPEAQEVEIEQSDGPTLLNAIQSGFAIVGVRNDSFTRTMRVLLKRSVP